jgi:hypothetical protein
MTRDRRPILILAIGVVFLAWLLAGQPSRAFADDDEGFVRLFNGRNLDGWDVHAGDKSLWAVEDGLIVKRRREHDAHSYLMTTSAYADFELRLEYKLLGAANCMVGFWLPVESPLKKGWHIRLINDADSLGLAQEQLTGSLYYIVGPTRTGASRPAGQWNQMTCVVQGARVIVDLNGVRVQDVNLDSPALMAKTVADPTREVTNLVGSPDPPLRRGCIGLFSSDMHGWVCFRNVKIKVLAGRARN